MIRADHTTGLIQRKRDASAAVIFTAAVAALELHITFQPVRLTSPWTFERLYGLSRLGRPVLIGLSVFFWAWVLWVLFWLYKASHGKYERLLVGSFAISFVLSVIKRFMSPQIAANVQFLSTGAALVSLVSAMVLLFTLPSKTTVT
jgi:uncharacterized BrkB/YihY/UPF0761 family membrane protein